MKKNDVMSAISSARRACEVANASLRGTANVLDPALIGKGSAGITRPTTEEERREAIMDAWYWMANAVRRAEKARGLALAYAKQNGITVQDIDRHGRRKGWLT
jgi:hypothetical protein